MRSKIEDKTPRCNEEMPFVFTRFGIMLCVQVDLFFHNETPSRRNVVWEGAPGRRMTPMQRDG